MYKNLLSFNIHTFKLLYIYVHINLKLTNFGGVTEDVCFLKLFNGLQFIVDK